MYNRLKDLRDDKDLSQEEVGKIINTTAAYYGAYEIGKRDLPFERAITLAKYYNVSLDYIAGLTNDKGGLHCNFLDHDQKRLLEAFATMKEDDKHLLIKMAETLCDKKQLPKEQRSIG